MSFFILFNFFSTKSYWEQRAVKQMCSPMVALRASGAAVYLEREEKNIDADDVTNYSIARSRIKGCNLS